MEVALPTLNSHLIAAAAAIDPTNLAMIVVGVVALAAIWLAATAIKGAKTKK